MSEPSALDARDDLRELADAYERVTALDLPLPSQGGGIGARVPQGAQEVLDADEVQRTLNLVDSTVFHWSMTLLDAEQIDDVPDLTPARARLVGEHTDWLLRHEGDRYALDFRDDLAEVLGRTRSLALRGGRKILTGAQCPHIGCGELLFSFFPADGTKDDWLHCPRGHEVPYETWQRWPRTKTTFITAQHAARLLGVHNMATVWQRAKRGKWRRVGSGRDVRYHVEDVRKEAGI